MNDNWCTIISHRSTGNTSPKKYRNEKIRTPLIASQEAQCPSQYFYHSPVFDIFFLWFPDPRNVLLFTIQFLVYHCWNKTKSCSTYCCSESTVGHFILHGHSSLIKPFNSTQLFHSKHWGLKIFSLSLSLKQLFKTFPKENHVHSLENVCYSLIKSGFAYDYRVCRQALIYI